MHKCAPEEEGEVPDELGNAIGAEGVDQVAGEEAEPAEHERAAHHSHRFGGAPLAFCSRSLLLLRRLWLALVIRRTRLSPAVTFDALSVCKCVLGTLAVS